MPREGRYALVGRTVGKQGSDLGTIYRGRTGQWAWIAHRVSGVGIILFLFAHVVDTAVVAWGPRTYERVLSVYHNPYVKLLELGLVAFVIFHAVNGMRILVIDFWPRATRWDRPLFYATVGIFVLAMIPITLLMGASILRDLSEG
jgi:succinate dehydrogenase / fumarate reductase cytochrome b subunit